MKWTADRMPDLSGRRAVVTGANSGIGLHTARALAAHGAAVTLACRNVERGQAAARQIRSSLAGADVTGAELDLASAASVQSFADRVADPVHLLINNAGVMAPPKPARTADGYELQFGTNHLGHFILTGMLLPRLLAAGDARVVTVSSIAHFGGGEDVLDGNSGPGYDPRHAYSNSKLANLLFALELQRLAHARGLRLSSVAAHPGVSATGLFSDEQGLGAKPLVRLAAPIIGAGLRLATQSAGVGARSTLYAATVAEPGSYTGPTRLGETRGAVGTARLSALADQPLLARRLWQISEEVTGFRWTWPDPARVAG